MTQDAAEECRKRTIWSLIRFPSSSIVRILKSMPIVVMKEGVHASSQKRRSKQDFPTPSPAQMQSHGQSQHL